ELAEALGRESAARAPGAIKNDFRVLVGELLLGLRLEVAPRQVNRPGDVSGAKLVLLADVDQGERRLALDLLLQVVEGHAAHVFPNFSEQVRIGLGHPCSDRTRVFRCGRCSISPTPSVSTRRPAPPPGPASCSGRQPPRGVILLISASCRRPLTDPQCRPNA